jgi:outer membrane protein
MKNTTMVLKIGGAVLSAIASVSIIGAGALAHAEEMKIGYVDMQKAIQETNAGKKAKKELESEFNAKKAELQKKEADLKKMNEDLEKKKVALSDDVRNKKQQELQQEMMKFQREVSESQMNIQKKERDLTQPIFVKLQEALDKVARAGGYSMVLEKSEQSVLWAKKELDLTDPVVKEFEKSAK